MDTAAGNLGERAWRSARRASFVALLAWLGVAWVVATVVGPWTALVTVPVSVPYVLAAMYVAERAYRRRLA